MQAAKCRFACVGIEAHGFCRGVHLVTSLVLPFVASWNCSVVLPVVAQALLPVKAYEAGDLFDQSISSSFAFLSL